MNLPVGALEVDHFTNTFRLYQEQYRTLKERALHLGHIPFHEFDAVHDVDFDVRPGLGGRPADRPGLRAPRATPRLGACAAALGGSCVCLAPGGSGIAYV